MESNACTGGHAAAPASVQSLRGRRRRHPCRRVPGLRPSHSRRATPLRGCTPAAADDDDDDDDADDDDDDDDDGLRRSPHLQGKPTRR